MSLHLATPHYRFCLILALTLFVLPLAHTATHAQAEEAVEAVIEKYLEALGGRDAFQELHSRVTRGSFSLPTMGIYATLETSVQPPDKMFTDVEGMASSGVNGDVVWDVNPMAGSRLLQGGEKLAALRRAELEPLLNWRKHFEKAELGEDKTVGDELCYQLILTPSEGDVVHMLISKDSYLLKQVENNSDLGQIITRVSDYRETDGVKIPYKIEIDTPQMSMEIALEKVEHNVEIPAQRFEIPAQIRSLLGNE